MAQIQCTVCLETLAIDTFRFLACGTLQIPYLYRYLTKFVPLPMQDMVFAHNARVACRREEIVPFANGQKGPHSRIQFTRILWRQVALLRQPHPEM